MKIELHRMTIREVLAGYKDSAEEGVTALNGALNIRPKYQREFVYNDKQRADVIRTVKHDFPLNVMYWMVNDAGTYEVLDGQQRTISIGQYIDSVFSLDDRFFHNLTKEEQDQIYDYELMVYFCEGTDKERIDWFRVINIAGAKLTDQEILNAVYTGPWLSDAKRHFSKTNCVAQLLNQDRGALLEGSPLRQDFLETALSWINHGDVADYMARHQHDANAEPLWDYIQNVFDWARTTFPVYRNEMKGLPWGEYYNDYKNTPLDPIALEAEVGRLMADVDIGNKRGIYAYVLDHKEQHLSIRAFDNRMKRQAYERQGGICPMCGNHFEIQEMEADHITPWIEGGPTTNDNCQMLCREDNRRKGRR